jgi:hypothetical protein
MFDLGNAITRSVIRPVTADTLGTGAVYSQPGQPRARVLALGPDEVPVDGVACEGWWADRCRVDLYQIASGFTCNLRLTLLCSNVERGDGAVKLFSRQIAVTPKTLAEPITLTLGIASGWLAKYWVLFGSTDLQGATVEFGARYTLDRGSSGLYTAFGDLTAP